MSKSWQEAGRHSSLREERKQNGASRSSCGSGGAGSDGPIAKCVTEEEEEVSPPCFVSAAAQNEMADFMVRDI